MRKEIILIKEKDYMIVKKIMNKQNDIYTINEFNQFTNIYRKIVVILS